MASATSSSPTPRRRSRSTPARSCRREYKVVAHAEDDKTIHFVIPPKPANTDELSDEDLEKVAGGIDLITGIAIGVAAVIGLSIAAGGANAVTRSSQGW